LWKGLFSAYALGPAEIDGRGCSGSSSRNFPKMPLQKTSRDSGRTPKGENNNPLGPVRVPLFEAATPGLEILMNRALQWVKNDVPDRKGYFAMATD
jgi:hypothetical protein